MELVTRVTKTIITTVWFELTVNIVKTSLQQPKRLINYLTDSGNDYKWLRKMFTCFWIMQMFFVLWYYGIPME